MSAKKNAALFNEYFEIYTKNQPQLKKDTKEKGKYIFLLLYV